MSPKAFNGLVSKKGVLFTADDEDGEVSSNSLPERKASGLGRLDLHPCPGH